MATTKKTAAKNTSKKPSNKKANKAPAQPVELPKTPKGLEPFQPALEAARAALAAKYPDASAALVAVKGDPLGTYNAVKQLIDNRIESFKTQEERTHIMECDHCGATSTDDTDICPFCGEGSPELEEARSKVNEAATQEEASSETPTPDETPSETTAITSEADTNRLELLTNTEAEIHRLEKDIKTNGYRLGQAILSVHEGELWKARSFKSFADWVEKETVIARGYAYDLMQAVKSFDEDTFLKVGPGKLIPLLQVKDQTERESILTDAKAGAPAREIRAKVNQSKSKSKKSTPAKEPKKTAPAKEDGGITLLAKVNGKATAYPFRSAESGRPLKTHNPGAYAEIVISKDVHQRIALRMDKEGNILNVEVAFVNVAKK